MKVDEPVEGPVTDEPLFVAGLLDAVLAGQAPIEFVFEFLEAGAKRQLVFCRDRTAQFSLLPSKETEQALDVLGLFLNPFQRALEIELTTKGALDVLVGGVADQRVTGTDVEVDVR